MAPQVVALITFVILFAFDAYCLLDIARAHEYEVRYFPRWIWMIICVMSTPLGGFAYLIYGRAR